MPVSESFRAFVLEQLGRAASSVRARNMFGGVGIYAGDCFFALIADDTLYFKVDDMTRPRFVALGMEPFRPYGEDGEVMQYYQVREELIEDPEELQLWVADAIAVAKRAKAGRRPKTGR
jgi:DNA transformation protein and related proteins